MTATEQESALEVDVLVIGGGIAGMSAAAYAAHLGMTVGVVERAAKLGGSAVLSGGKLWVPNSAEAFLALDPAADRDLVELLVDQFDTGADWIASLGVDIAPPMALDMVQGFPSHAREFDNLGYIQRCEATVLQHDGWVVTGATVERLLREGSAVVGVRARDQAGAVDVVARYTVLATGGFQGDPDLRARYIGEHAAELLVRSNPESRGAGLELGLAAGAELRLSPAFYGHLMPTPLPQPIATSDYRRFTQIYSPRGVLLDETGRRFVDESVSYYNNAVAVSGLPNRRALLVADEAVIRFDRMKYGFDAQIDRPREAAAAGARVAHAPSIGELADAVAAWGYSHVASGLERYHEGLVGSPDDLDPPRRANRQVLSEAPFVALEVVPAITFTFGGLRVDRACRVLDHAGEPIPGLLAAGVDIGAYHRLYAGGLSLGLVTGMQAARTAAARQREDE